MEGLNGWGGGRVKNATQEGITNARVSEKKSYEEPLLQNLPTI